MGIKGCLNCYSGTGVRVSSRSPQASSPDGANVTSNSASTGAVGATTATSSGTTSTSPPPAQSSQPRSPDGPSSPQSASALAAAVARVAASPRSHVNGCSPGPDHTQGKIIIYRYGRHILEASVIFTTRTDIVLKSYKVVCVLIFELSLTPLNPT